MEMNANISYALWLFNIKKKRKDERIEEGIIEQEINFEKMQIDWN